MFLTTGRVTGDEPDLGYRTNPTQDWWVSEEETTRITHLLAGRRGS